MWIVTSIVLGFTTMVLMSFLCLGSAAASMAGQVDYSIMYGVSIPAALISAFLMRKAGILKALLAAVAFSAPIVWLCFDRVQELSAQQTLEYLRAAQQWKVIGIVTVASALLASLISSNGTAIGRAKPPPQD